jgi:hypothetical protein
MDGSHLVFIVLPTVSPLVLAIGSRCRSSLVEMPPGRSRLPGTGPDTAASGGRGQFVTYFGQLSRGGEPGHLRTVTPPSVRDNLNSFTERPAYSRPGYG